MFFVDVLYYKFLIMSLGSKDTGHMSSYDFGAMDILKKISLDI